MQFAIKLDNVSLSIDKKQILSSISTQIKPGSIVGLIGPSGAGKTTLIRALLGLRPIDKGSITILNQRAGAKQLKSKIGYVSQALSVYPDLTIEENIRYFATLLGLTRHDTEKVISAVELDEFRHQVVETLSGGQKARVSLATALLGQPEILLLDEPTVGLDPVLRQNLWAKFKNIAQNGTTIVITSHAMDEADKCDHLMFMRQGQLLIADSKESVLKKTGTDSMENAFLRLAKGASNEY